MRFTTNLHVRRGFGNKTVTSLGDKTVKVIELTIIDYCAYLHCQSALIHDCFLNLKLRLLQNISLTLIYALRVEYLTSASKTELEMAPRMFLN